VTRRPTESEQKLATIVVQVAITAAECLHGKTTEEVALWAARQLSDCGYKNHAVGASWARLTEVDDR
jgi:hypothetical protein